MRKVLECPALSLLARPNKVEFDILLPAAARVTIRALYFWPVRTFLGGSGDK